MSISGTTKPDWIAVDWGTSHLRVAAIAGDGSVLDRQVSDMGMGKLRKDEFEPTLLALISDWLCDDKITRVVCCGMVGSRQGWVETDYRTAPCDPISGSGGTTALSLDGRIEVTVIPGIKQQKPADVMRGEETQIAGLLAMQPDFDGVVCLPGTHSKWVRISAAEVVSFTTFLTGELFSLLSRQSVLQHSVASDRWNEVAFLAALDDAIAAPKMFASRLFSLRAEHLIEDLAPHVARSRLSGLLIGLELAAARPYYLGQNVAILGADALANIYEKGLKAQGLTPQLFDAETATIAGLSVAHSRLPKPRITA